MANIKRLQEQNAELVALLREIFVEMQGCCCPGWAASISDQLEDILNESTD